MNTATYIKEVNNTPVLFNIDNARDMANLEALQAIKMPVNMANEIFGDNIRYADNTPCIITENSGNAEFPFNVQFDSSKIPAKPQTERKLTENYLAGTGMPNNDKYINISLRLSSEYDKNTYTAEFTAPANGWIFVGARSYGSNVTVCRAGIYDLLNLPGTNDIPTIGQSTLSPPGGQLLMSMLPVRKGDVRFIYIVNCARFGSRFYYAEGEI